MFSNRCVDIDSHRSELGDERAHGIFFREPIVLCHPFAEELATTDVLLVQVVGHVGLLGCSEGTIAYSPKSTKKSYEET